MGIVAERHSVSIHGTTYHVKKWIDREIEVLTERNRGLPFHGDIVQPNGAIELKLKWLDHEGLEQGHNEERMWKAEYIELEELFDV
jgi:hypothetical protein